MRIKSVYPDEESFPKVLARFNSAADERGIARKEAMVEAMKLWLGSDSTTWVTDAEWRELAPELERIRARNRAREDKPSSGKEPAP